jgi:hypothetical protein
MPKRLSDEEIRIRMVELRNLRRLHKQDQQVKSELRNEIKKLKVENKELRTAVETLKIQMVELQNMVFGKKRKPPTGHHVPNVLKPIPKARDVRNQRVI